MIKNLGMVIKSWFKMVDSEVRGDEVVCPQCEGIGCEDVFISCDICNGFGKIKKDNLATLI